MRTRRPDADAEQVEEPVQGSVSRGGAWDMLRGGAWDMLRGGAWDVSPGGAWDRTSDIACWGDVIPGSGDRDLYSVRGWPSSGLIGAAGLRRSTKRRKCRPEALKFCDPRGEDHTFCESSITLKRTTPYIVTSSPPSARIRLLPETVVNRIAAGEVIERPAAAVKELVENALDAGATRVSVVMETGGIDRIEVVDNGGGMDADGLALAVQRHATSKLADDDLVRIATLGFRGEALPSIGAAARLLIVSRPPGGAAAHAIRVEGGRVGEVAPAPGAEGTRVVMRDLFYATPARRKFLKHPRTEGDAAEAVLRRLALAAPGVAMRAEIDGRVAFDLRGRIVRAGGGAAGGDAAAA